MGKMFLQRINNLKRLKNAKKLRISYGQYYVGTPFSIRTNIVVRLIHKYPECFQLYTRVVATELVRVYLAPHLYEPDGVEINERKRG